MYITNANVVIQQFLRGTATSADCGEKSDMVQSYGGSVGAEHVRCPTQSQ